MASNRKQASNKDIGTDEGETYSSMAEITTSDDDNSLDLEGSSNDDE